MRETQDGSGGGSSTAKGSDKESGAFQASTGMYLQKLVLTDLMLG